MIRFPTTPGVSPMRPAVSAQTSRDMRSPVEHAPRARASIADLDLFDRIILGAALLLALAVGMVTSQVAPAVDTWRDLFHAYLIASGEAYPTIGPVIGGIAHLGPIWFYLLAVPFAVGGVPAALGTIGFLAALKYPLGYLVGRRFLGRPVAIAMLPALAMPGWFQFDILWLTHTSVVVTLLFGLVLAADRYRQGPGLLRAAIVGLLAGLAFHAHPTTLLLVALATIWALGGTFPLRTRALHATVAAGAGLALLLPQVIGLVSGTNEDVRTVGAFLSSGLHPVLERLPPLLGGIAWVGPGIVIDFWLAPEPWSPVLRFLHGLALALAVAGLVREVAGGRHTVIILLGILALHSMFVLALREMTPFWMVQAHAPIVAFLLAIGWASLWQGFASIRPVLVGVALAYGLLLALLFRFAISSPVELRLPTYAPGSFGLMSVESRPSGSKRVANPGLPVGSLDELASGLCGGAVTYGHLGALIDVSYGIGVRRRCGDVDDILIGGPPRPGIPAIIGLNEGAQRALTGGETITRGLWLASIRSRVGHGVNLPISAGRTIPHRDLSGFAPSLETHELLVAPDSMVVIVHRAVGHHPFRASVHADSGEAVRPVYQDLMLQIYLPSGTEDAEQTWRIEIDGVQALVDVLVAERPRAH